MNYVGHSAEFSIYINLKTSKQTALYGDGKYKQLSK